MQFAKHLHQHQWKNKLDKNISRIKILSEVIDMFNQCILKCRSIGFGSLQPISSFSVILAKASLTPGFSPATASHQYSSSNYIKQKTGKCHSISLRFSYCNSAWSAKACNVSSFRKSPMASHKVAEGGKLLMHDSVNFVWHCFPGLF